MFRSVALLLKPLATYSLALPAGSRSISSKRSWKSFVDLQCPFARKFYVEHRPDIESHFGDQFEFSTHLTSLAFHPQAFVGQKAAKLIELNKGIDSKLNFVDACFINQDRYKDTGDARPSEVDVIFANIAEEAGIFSDEAVFTRDFFLEHINDWDAIVKPTYAEHKVALGYGVFGTPKFVIDDKLVEGTESSWGPEEWETKLQEIDSQIDKNDQ